jgi:hypothetical protein
MLELALNNELLMAVALFAISFVGGRMFNRGAGAREEAAIVAQKLRKYGMDEIPQLLEAYSMRDIPGLVKQMRHLHMIVKNEDLVKQELADVFEKLLAERVQNPVLRAVIESRIAAAKAADESPTK